MKAYSEDQHEQKSQIAARRAAKRRYQRQSGEQKIKHATPKHSQKGLDYRRVKRLADLPEDEE